MADIGDNSVVKLDETTKEKLKQTAAKIDRLEEEKKAVGEDIKEVYAEAKAFGFDTTALRAAVRRRKIDRQTREEQDAMLEVYETVLLEAEML